MVTATGNSGALPQNFLPDYVTLNYTFSDETSSQTNDDTGNRGVMPINEGTPLITKFRTDLPVSSGATNTPEKVPSCWERMNPKRYYENMDSKAQDRVRKFARYGVLTLGTTVATGTTTVIYAAIKNLDFPPYLYAVTYGSAFVLSNIFWSCVFYCPSSQVITDTTHSGFQHYAW